MLSLIIFVSFLSSLLVVSVNSELFAKCIAVISSVISFVCSIILLLDFDPLKPSMQLTEIWLGCELFGIDAISLALILLTGLLFVLCIINIIYSDYPEIRSYLSLFLLLEGLIVGAFASINVVAFYIFFEAILIPMFFIIGIWGSSDRIYATFKLFLYTLAGSMFFLISLIYLCKVCGSADVRILHKIAPTLSLDIQKWLWLGFFLSFAVKIPMIPFHTWLPDAHVQAPTAGSVILAGVLIKMGGYGFVRFSLPMLPEASVYFANLVMTLSIIAVIYTSLIAFAQTNIKKLIAYSSIAHMGLVTAGLFSFNEYGLSGAVFQMISHGLISSALFLCVGVVYNRSHNLEISSYGGLASTMPKYSVMFIFFVMASIGLPGTAGFIGEFLPMLGAFGHFKFWTLFLTTSVILSAVYMLSLGRRIIWGVGSYSLPLTDLKRAEFATLLLLVVLVLALGVYPAPILNVYLKPAVTGLLFSGFGTN